MESLNEVIMALHDRMAAFESDLKKSSTPATSEAIQDDYTVFKQFTLAAIKSIQQQVEILARVADQQEIRSRRKILLVHGVPEDSKEDTAAVVTKTLSTQAKVPNFTIAQVSRCHRMGKASNADRPRPILVKMHDIVVKEKVWFAKTNLKGSGITLSEFLTRPRHIAFMAARERFGIKNCWTRDGQIHVVAPDGARHRICSLGELNKLSLPDTQKPAKKTATPVVKSAKETKAPPATRSASRK